MGRKNFISFILLLRAFLLVSETYDTLKFFSYQNLDKASLMLKNYNKNTLFLTLILKQYFVFYKIVHNFVLYNFLLYFITTN